MSEVAERPDEDIKQAPEPNSIVAKSAENIADGYRVVRFRGRPMVEVYEPFPHFVPLHKEMFDRIAYPILGGVSRSRMGDVFAYLSNTAEDLTGVDHYILFGRTEIGDDGEIVGQHKDAVTTVWDTDGLSMAQHIPPNQAVWRSPYAKIPMNDPEGDSRVPFVLQLAGGDAGLYDDIMQSLAPLVMKRKPDGVIWWVGDGANGKSTLMDAIYKIFPGQLSSITVKRLVDGRDTPSLNGTLGNVVKESSEGRVEDTEIYKSIGTHEDFRVHKFHSQDDILVSGNLHHIFSANQIPTFNDKGYSARRRTFIIPFTERFTSDPTFEEKTFTPEMFGRLITEMCKYAIRLKQQNYRYKWSAKTLAAKADYDAAASNAEEYARYIIARGLVAFDSYNNIKMDYENWCADVGYVPLGITNLRRAMTALGFERISTREEDERVGKQYRLPNFEARGLQQMGVQSPGLYTVPGFETPDEPKITPPVPEFNDVKSEEVKDKDIIGDKW